MSEEVPTNRKKVFEEIIIIEETSSAFADDFWIVDRVDENILYIFDSFTQMTYTETIIVTS